MKASPKLTNLTEAARAAAAPSDVMPYPPAGRGWWMITVFAIAAVLQYTDRQILSLLVDPIRADLGISDTGIGILQGAAFAVLYSLVGLPLGRVADLLPRRSVIVAGVLLWSMATVASGLATGFGQLLLCRIFVGIGEAALAPAAASMIVDTFAPARRGTAVGLFLMGQVIGGGAALAIGGYLLDLAVQGDLAWMPLIGALAPWRAVLVLVGLPGLIVAALLLGVAEPVRRRNGDNGAPGRALPLSAVAQGFRARAGLLVPLYLANALVSIGDYGLLAWSPAFLSRNFDFAPAMIGTLLGGIAIVTGIIGTAGGGYLADRLSLRSGASARLKLVFAASLLGVLGACAGLMPTASGVLFALTLWMLASAVSGTVAIAVVLEALPNEMRGIGTSLVAFCNTILGLGLGPTLVATVTEQVFADSTAVGLAMTLVTLPAALIAAGLFYRALRVLPHGPSTAPPPPKSA